MVQYNLFMKPIISVIKPVGMTPLQIIHKLREAYPEYANATLGYAGRLDPMAEGILLVLVNEENLKRKEYERLPKTYEFEALYGIETDTYDVLGLIQSMNLEESLPDIGNKIETAMHTFLGKHIQPYPPYSSPRVKGKPLFYWAREGKLDEIKIPSKEIEIYEMQCMQTRTINSDELKEVIFTKLKSVKGEFRQEKIIKTWEQFFVQHPTHTFTISTLIVSCSSGTYVRSITHELGKKLGTRALALSIKRTQVGKYTLENALQLP